MTRNSALMLLIVSTASVSLTQNGQCDHADYVSAPGLFAPLNFVVDVRRSLVHVLADNHSIAQASTNACKSSRSTSFLFLTLQRRLSFVRPTISRRENLNGQTETVKMIRIANLPRWFCVSLAITCIQHDLLEMVHEYVVRRLCRWNQLLCCRL